MPLSPLEPGSHTRAQRRSAAARRRARRLGRIRLAVLLAFVAAIVVLVVVATSSGTGHQPPQQQAAGSTPSPSGSSRHAKRDKPKRSRSKVAAGAQLPAADTEAIDDVLAYTPFITGGTPRHRVIALSFDDGPSPYTEGIVGQLVRLHVPATFFIVGQQLNDFSAGLRDELAHGFVIGDHTENHEPLNALPEGQQYSQIHDAADRMTRAGVPFPRLFRPPYGVYNRTSLSLLHGFKMLMVLWSVDPRDWTRPGTAEIVKRVLSAARPGAIVELHDGGGDRSETEAALPAIVNGLRRRHYAFVTIPELLRLDPPPRGQRLPSLSE